MLSFASPIGAFDSYNAWLNWLRISVERNEAYAPWDLQYRALRAYYFNNGLYEVLNKILSEVQMKADKRIMPLMNPANTIVEFYAGLVWPGQLPDAIKIEAKNDRTVEAIMQVWEWSDFSSLKQQIIRDFAMTGDSFIRIATNSDGDSTPNEVYMEMLLPEFVTDMRTNKRNVLEFIRIDYPTQDWDDRTGEKKNVYVTEVFTLKDYRMWRTENRRSAKIALTDLGAPAMQRPLSAWGIDFIPIAYSPWRKIGGEERGVGSYTLILDNIDAVNREATQLLKMLFRYNRAFWAVTGIGQDKQGRPLGAVRMDKKSVKVAEDDDSIVSLPGSADFKALVPPLHYKEALEVLENMMKHTIRIAPEMIYAMAHEMNERGELSGKAIYYLLTNARNKLDEAQGVAFNHLQNCHRMAIKVGNAAGIFSAGDGKDLDHKFKPKPFMLLSDVEKATAFRERTAGGMPIVTAVREEGWTDEQIEVLKTDLQEQQDWELAIETQKIKTQAAVSSQNKAASSTGGN
jgi:hypothetical protein